MLMVARYSCILDMPHRPARRLECSRHVQGKRLAKLLEVLLDRLRSLVHRTSGAWDFAEDI